MAAGKSELWERIRWAMALAGSENPIEPQIGLAQLELLNNGKELDPDQHAVRIALDHAMNPQ
jgi:hypothetical protein